MSLIRRKDWEEKSGKIGDRFDVNAAMNILSDDILRDAKDLHDRLLGQSGDDSSGYKSQVLCMFVFFPVFHLQTCFSVVLEFQLKMEAQFNVGRGWLGAAIVEKATWR